ncbi:MAG: DivIVA domain-containing protein [Propionibacteriaceae bacterium]|nr:DivIVA domain-containing protein [Propionibacteriaceae bacterium]
MAWLIASLAVVVLGFASVVGSGGLGQFGPLVSDRQSMELPEGPWTSEQLGEIQFTVVPRGYAMDQVDEVLSRLQHQLSCPASEDQKPSQ